VNGLEVNLTTMLPAITKFLPHLPRVFRHKTRAKSVSNEQNAASDIVRSSVAKHLSFRVVLLDNSELTLFAKVQILFHLFTSLILLQMSFGF
jgi:hypothetical protein